MPDLKDEELRQTHPFPLPAIRPDAFARSRSMPETASAASVRRRVVLVTGAARGHGLATARAFAEQGQTVYLADIGADLPGIPYTLSSRADLDGAVAGLRSLPGTTHGVLCDVRDGEAVDRAVTRIEVECGGVDILVNNAGVLALRPLTETSEQEWAVHLDVIAKGAFLCCRRVLPGMNARGWGRIVNVASVAGHRGLGTAVAYTAAKHALIGLTRALAMETARQHVTVNAVCPGTAATALVRGTGRALGLGEREALARFSERHLSGEPLRSEDVAAAVCWLASDDAARVNGSSLFVDDGWHAH
jgi:NAD(P)-dependent dehydrogenase (short-subunit alcohol dehydrogenase family)